MFCRKFIEQAFFLFSFYPLFSKLNSDLEWIDITDKCTFNPDLTIYEANVYYKKGEIFFDIVCAGCVDSEITQPGITATQTIVFELPIEYKMLGAPVRMIGNGSLQTICYIFASANTISVSGINISQWCAMSGILPISN